MTKMFGEEWPPMSVPDLAPDDDDRNHLKFDILKLLLNSDKNTKLKCRGLFEQIPNL